MLRDSLKTIPVAFGSKNLSRITYFFISWAELILPWLMILNFIVAKSNTSNFPTCSNLVNNAWNVRLLVSFDALLQLRSSSRCRFMIGFRFLCFCQFTFCCPLTGLSHLGLYWWLAYLTKASEDISWVMARSMLSEYCNVAYNLHPYSEYKE